MRVASLVMVIIGVVFGVMMGLVAMAVGSVSNALGGSGTIAIWLGVSALGSCFFAMICAVVHFNGNRTTLMSWLLLVTVIWHVVSISAFAIPGAFFLLLGTIFAWFSRHRVEPQPQVA